MITKFKFFLRNKNILINVKSNLRVTINFRAISTIKNHQWNLSSLSPKISEKEPVNSLSVCHKINTQAAEFLTLENINNTKYFEFEKDHNEFNNQRPIEERYDPKDFILYPNFISDGSEQDLFLRFLLYQLDLKLKPKRNKNRVVLKRNDSSDSDDKKIDVLKNSDEEFKSKKEIFLEEIFYKFEEGHFDRVITNYREIQIDEEQLRNPRVLNKNFNDESKVIENILDRLNEKFYEALLFSKILNRSREKDGEEGKAVNETIRKMEEPLKHILHLSSSGKIKSHLDNIDSSGSIIIGLSLGNKRVMRLSYPGDYNDSNDYRSNPGGREVSKNDIKVLLPPGSLYVQRDSVRYKLEHSIESSDIFNGS
ncbi:expressed protein [Phakopsora pachyrhizi]|uniref:Expressed protein n=1 Tax=Phakopsora pachyrhizi TaxID=170000 RepID=A0AAV0BC16_PHAPC|nr:expressed protein [Phakopsora pachyrhizi]